MILIQKVDEPCDSCNRTKDVRELKAFNERKNEAYHLHLCNLCLDVVSDMVEDHKPSFRMDANGNLYPVDD